MSIPYLEIRYPGSVAFIAPVARSRVNALELLLRSLYQRWIELRLSTSDLLNDASSWQLMIRIAGLFPRIDVVDKLGFDISALKDDPDQLEELFLAVCGKDDQLSAPKLAVLNCFDPLPVPAWRQDEDAAPITSSSDPDMDLLAMLTVSSNAQDAIALMDRLNTQQLDRYLFYLAELRRDPEERKQEELANDYLAWKEENPEILREALGVKFAYPVDAS